MVTLLYSAAKYPNRLDALIDHLMIVPSASTTSGSWSWRVSVAAVAVSLARRHSSLANLVLVPARKAVSVKFLHSAFTTATSTFRCLRETRHLSRNFDPAGFITELTLAFRAGEVQRGSASHHRRRCGTLRNREFSLNHQWGRRGFDTAGGG